MAFSSLAVLIFLGLSVDQTFFNGMLASLTAENVSKLLRYDAKEIQRIFKISFNKALDKVASRKNFPPHVKTQILWLARLESDKLVSVFEAKSDEQEDIINFINNDDFIAQVIDKFKEIIASHPQQKHIVISDNDIEEIFNETISIFQSQFLEELTNDKGVGIILRELPYIRKNFKTLQEKIEESQEVVIDELTDFKVSLFRELTKKERAYYNALTQYDENQKSLYENVVLKNEKGMKLHDIYVEPKFSFYEKCLGNFLGDITRDNFKGFADVSGFVRVYNFSIHEYVNESFLRKAKNRILLVLGDPGQGKTSFCKKLIYDQLNQNLSNKKIFYIQLRYLGIFKKFYDKPFEAIEEYLKEELEEIVGESVNFESVELKRCILVLDGLDELKMFDKDGYDYALFTHLLFQCNRFQQLQIIITSRTIYVDLKNLDEDYLVLRLDNFEEEEQITWATKYEQFYPDNSLTVNELKKLQQNNQYDRLKVFLGQPILLHIAASTNQKIDEETTLESLYDILFQQMIEKLIQRDWSEDGQLNALKTFKKKEIEFFLEAVAFQMFCDGEEYILSNGLEEIEELKEIYQKLKKVTSEELSEALRTLLISFYFKEVKTKHLQKKESFAIEFLHKSFREYLTANYIWNKIKEVLNNNKFNTDEASNIFQRLFRKWIPSEVMTFLYSTIDKERDFLPKEFIENYYKTLFSIIYSDIHKDLNFDSGIHKTEAVLCVPHFMTLILSKLVNGIFKETDIPNKARSVLFYYLGLTNQVKNIDLRNIKMDDGLYSGVGNTNYRELDFSGGNFYKNNPSGKSFKKSNFSNCTWEDSTILYCDFSHTNLHKTDFTNLTGMKIDFSRATFNETILNIAKLEDCDFALASIKNIHTYNVTFDKSFFLYSHFSNSEYRNSFFRKTEIVETKIENIIFNNCKFKETKGKSLTAKSVVFHSCDFKSIVFNNSRFLNCKFMECDFEGAEFYNCDFSSVEKNGLENEQLFVVKKLVNCQGIDKETIEILKEIKPEAFTP